MAKDRLTEQFSVRLPVDLIDRLDARADVNERTRTGEIIWLLRYALAKLEPKKKPNETA